MRVIILDKNSHLKFHSISLAFLVKKKDQKQISWEITCQRNKHSMTGIPAALGSYRQAHWMLPKLYGLISKDKPSRTSFSTALPGKIIDLWTLFIFEYMYKFWSNVFNCCHHSQDQATCGKHTCTYYCASSIVENLVFSMAINSNGISPPKLTGCSATWCTWPLFLLCVHFSWF